ncbi:hypothetical protein MNBD_GAMMA06-574 [hydrothermal vent metagenome]|uniref:Fibronectin type-III domain-containing protein n=1 Tax=hydrothermal vent metagenome TaxID=652676 RepID=A0A3B0WQ57_9ZZZZ
MSFLYFYSFLRVKLLLTVVLALHLAACSGGDGGEALGLSARNQNLAIANALNLTWTAPSEREDGTGLSLSEIAGYRIYYGPEAGDYQNQINIDDTSADDAQVTQLESGVYYVVMTTIDTDGRESAYSSEVVVQLL